MPYQAQGGNNYQQNYNLPPLQQTPSPITILEDSIKNVLYFLTQPESNNKELLRKYIYNEIAPNFDFDYMARWVAGKRYYVMNEKQQVMFKQKFKQVFIINFIKKITQNKKSLPRASRFISKRQTQTEAHASVWLSYFEGQRVKVDFRFLKTSHGWKVVDVKGNGLSALLYYRNYFLQMLRQRKVNN